MTNGRIAAAAGLAVAVVVSVVGAALASGVESDSPIGRVLVTVREQHEEPSIGGGTGGMSPVGEPESQNTAEVTEPVTGDEPQHIENDPRQDPENWDGQPDERAVHGPGDDPRLNQSNWDGEPVTGDTTAEPVNQNQLPQLDRELLDELGISPTQTVTAFGQTEEVSILNPYAIGTRAGRRYKKAWEEKYGVEWGQQ